MLTVKEVGSIWYWIYKKLCMTSRSLSLICCITNSLRDKMLKNECICSSTLMVNQWGVVVTLKDYSFSYISFLPFMAFYAATISRIGKDLMVKLEG